jgi:hypothetical protein
MPSIPGLWNWSFATGAFLKVFQKLVLLLAATNFLFGCATYSEVRLPDMTSHAGVEGEGQKPLAVGQSVRVTPIEGTRIEGKVEELTEMELVIVSSPNYGEHKIAFPWGNISKIESIKDPGNQGLLFVGSIIAVLIFSTAVGWIDWHIGGSN